MKSNETLQRDVQESIKWEPLLHAAQIGVIAKNGIVTLTGTVDSYAKKMEAETATKKVAGVKAIVEKIEIDYGLFGKITDDKIAEDILKEFKSNLTVPSNSIKVTVENGWVTLEGNVNWNYQREATKNSVTNLMGVRGISNNIKINPEIKEKVEKRAIEKAFQRNWAINYDEIDVDVYDNNVRLTGNVDSYYQKDEAERIAWNAPGVWSVNNDLEVGYYE
jgi:osmotically-inducible protein OsmY